jgi:hypothetical protein
MKNNDYATNAENGGDLRNAPMYWPGDLTT